MGSIPMLTFLVSVLFRNAEKEVEKDGAGTGISGSNDGRDGNTVWIPGRGIGIWSGILCTVFSVG